MVAGGYLEHSKYVYNEMPDFTLSVLQDRFNAKNLEQMYKKYEQRYQLSELLSQIGLVAFIKVLFR